MITATSDPRIVHTNTVQGETDTVFAVCRECGWYDDVELVLAHLSRCEPIPAPFYWDFRQTVTSTDDPYVMLDVYCNDHLILIGAANEYEEGFPEAEDLNLWQCSPFELVTGEYLFRYDLGQTLNKLFDAVNNKPDATSVGWLRDNIARALPYMGADDIEWVEQEVGERILEYREALATLLSISTRRSANGDAAA